MRSNQENGKYLPIDELDPALVRIYEKYESKKNYRRIVHLDRDDPTKCHDYRGFNQFLAEKEDLPDWKFRKYTDLRNICDPKNEFFSKEDAIDFESLYPEKLWKRYVTLNNGSCAFLVFVNEDRNQVVVYGHTRKIIPMSLRKISQYHNGDISSYTRVLFSFSYSQIFIGKSELNHLTAYSGGHGPAWDGNSILIKLDNDSLEYVHIGEEIILFQTSEPITTFTSSVGNSATPYPYAESKNMCYSLAMQQRKSTPCEEHPNRKYEGNVSYFEDAHYEFYEYSILANRNSTALSFEMLFDPEYRDVY